MSASLNPYLTGERLYGDDFTQEEIDRWFEDEREGYAELGAKDRLNYVYPYHSWNEFHGFRHLRQGPFKNVLGFGSAYGDEFASLAPRIDALTIIDPSDLLRSENVFGIPVRYVVPCADGRLPFSEGSFDLITCLGVLHHLPNVSTVLRELVRCLAPAGFLILREPIVSMGDWSKPRAGLTMRERGIPIRFLDQFFAGPAAVVVVYRGLCGFPAIPRLYRPFRKDPYNSSFAVRLDAWLSKAFSYRLSYHPRGMVERIQPSAVYFVVRKG